MEVSYVDNPFLGSCYSDSKDDLLEDWLPKKKQTKFKELLKERKVAIISISIAIFIATCISVALAVNFYSSPCKNNGVYYKDGEISKCNCSGSGFFGDQCETQIWFGTNMNIIEGIKLIHNDTFELCEDKNITIHLSDGIDNCVTEPISAKKYSALEWSFENGQLSKCENFYVSDNTTFKVNLPSCNKIFPVEVVVQLDHGPKYKSEVIDDWQDEAENTLELCNDC